MRRRSRSRSRRTGFSQSAESYDNICAMFQEIMACLPTPKGNPGRIFMKFEMKVVLKFHFVCVLIGFS